MSKEKTANVQEVKELKKVKFPWRVVLLEIPLFFGVLQILDHYASGINLHVLELSPHPYWLGIMAFAITYGLPAGTLSGAIAGILLTDWRAIQTMDAMNLAGEMFTPFAMLMGGIYLGSMTTRRYNLIADLENSNDERGEMIDDIQEDRDKLIQVNLSLEKKVVSREDTVLTLYEAARNLSSLKQDEIYPTIPKLLEAYIKALRSSVYLHENFKLKCVIRHEWENDEQYPAEYDRDHQLYRLIQQKLAVLSVHELQGIDEAIIIAPLVTQDQRLYGMIKIEKLAFVNLTPASIKLIEMLADWIIRAIENARMYGLSSQAQVRDPESGAHTMFYFHERLRREIRLSRRYQLDLSIIFIKIIDFDSMREEAKKTLLWTVFRSCEFRMRQEDIIARVNNHQIQFAILLPFTKMEGAKIAYGKCADDILGYGFRPFDDENKELQLDGEIVETQDQSLYTHDIVLEALEDQEGERVQEMVDRIIK